MVAVIAACESDALAPPVNPADVDLPDPGLELAAEWEGYAGHVSRGEQEGYVFFVTDDRYSERIKNEIEVLEAYFDRSMDEADLRFEVVEYSYRQLWGFRLALKDRSEASEAYGGALIWWTISPPENALTLGIHEDEAGSVPGIIEDLRAHGVPEDALTFEEGQPPEPRDP